MTALRTQLEDAVIVRLGRLKRAASGGYVHTVASYNGELTPSRQDEHFQRVTRGALPAILVTTGDGAYSDLTMGRQADLDFTLELLVASSILRSLEDANRGDGLSQDPGIYQMIEDIREQLFRREIGVNGIGWLLPASETTVLRESDRSIWQLTYQVTADVAHAPVEDELGDYDSIHNEVNFPAADDGAPANPVVEFDQTGLAP